MTSNNLKACRGASTFVAALLLLMTAALAAAQTDTGRLVGKIVDPNGAVVTGATVRVKSVGTGREVTTTSDNEGVYTVVGLLPGFYDVTVEGGSFQPNTQRVQVTVGSNVTLETKMALTEVSGGTVNVVASEGLAVNTQTAEVSNIVTGNQIRQLPTLTRNPYDLIGLGGNINNDDPGPPVPGVGLAGRGAGFSINGQRASSTNVLLDGVDNNSVFYGSLAQNVPLEAVAEFRVVTSNFSAEYGRASGGIVNVAVLSGSNDFHGSAYEFNRISKLASNGFNNNANNVPRGVFTRNQFGYAIGGPNKHQKLFIFNHH